MDVIKAMIILLIITIVIVAGAFIVPRIAKPAPTIDDCLEDCTALDYEFLQYDHPYFGQSAKCWCQINNQPVQIW